MCGGARGGEWSPVPWRMGELFALESRGLAWKTLLKRRFRIQRQERSDTTFSHGTQHNHPHTTTNSDGSRACGLATRCSSHERSSYVHTRTQREHNRHSTNQVARVFQCTIGYGGSAINRACAHTDATIERSHRTKSSTDSTKTKRPVGAARACGQPKVNTTCMAITAMWRVHLTMPSAPKAS